MRRGAGIRYRDSEIAHLRAGSGCAADAGAAGPTFSVMVTKDGYATIIATNPDTLFRRSLELWGLPEGATIPVSLGLLPTTGRLRMKAIFPAGT